MVGILISNKINNILLFKSGHQRKIKERKRNKNNIIFHTHFPTTWCLGRKILSSSISNLPKNLHLTPCKRLVIPLNNNNNNNKEELAKKKGRQFIWNIFRLHTESKVKKDKTKQDWVGIGGMISSSELLWVLVYSRYNV